MGTEYTLNNNMQWFTKPTDADSTDYTNWAATATLVGTTDPVTTQQLLHEKKKIYIVKKKKEEHTEQK